MRRRASARLLVLDPAGRLLLFRFVHRTGALAGQDYWATPGGAVEDGETFEQAALRELEEETGMRAASAGREAGQRAFMLQLPSGERVIADERYFLIHAATGTVSHDCWTAEEAGMITEHRWWSVSDLTHTGETVWPDNLAALLEQSGAVQIG